MNDDTKTYIKTSALLNFKIFLDDDIPAIELPSINSLGKDIFIYLHCLTNYMELFEDYKDNIYSKIIESESSIVEFGFFINFFIDTDDLKFEDGKFIMSKGQISEENIGKFIRCIRVLHHQDKKDDDYVPLNTIAAKMMLRARKLKREVQAKISRNSESGLHEIISAITCRHPSLNLLEVGKLTYYQIIETYKRLNSIDKYTPCLYGNATEDYIKKNDVKHYSLKINNE